MEVVRWLGRVRLATVDQVRVRMGMGRTKAYERLAGLVACGLVVHERGAPGHGVYLASREGLRMAGLQLAPAAVSLGGLVHDLAVAEVVAWLEAQMPGCWLLTERELRAHVRESGDLTFRPRVQQRGMRESRHWPDLVLLTGGERPGWLAIEVELQRKGAQRLEAILRGYARTNYRESRRELWGVLYLVPDQAAATRVASIARRTDLGMDSDPVFSAHTLDEPDAITTTIGGMWRAKEAVKQRQREEAEQRAEHERRLAAEQAAQQAAMEALTQRHREEQQRALEFAHARDTRRGLGRILGGSGR